MMNDYPKQRGSLESTLANRDSGKYIRRNTSLMLQLGIGDIIDAFDVETDDKNEV
jgi:hypothetical protein